MTTLTKDEIIAWARDANIAVFKHGTIDGDIEDLQRFAHLCRADLVAERDAAIERADELGADKGTYFRLYEQACIQMTEKDRYGEHYRTLFNNADTANNRLIDERDALRAENQQLRDALSGLEKPIAWMCSDESLVHKGYSRFSRNCEGDWNIPVYTVQTVAKETK